jgi:DNA-binding transcriptional regulator PaaX
MTKYKYYLKKPKGEITKDILQWTLTAGVVAIAATSSPFFLLNAVKAFTKTRKGQRHKRKDIYNAFYRLRCQGCLDFKEENNQVYISLTEDGRKKAGWMQINHLAIKAPKQWKKRWYLIIFDIAHNHRAKREALRGLIKRLGLYQLQKSVWAYPHDCTDEIELLRDFFGLSENELRVVVAENIGDDIFLRKKFDC